MKRKWRFYFLLLVNSFIIGRWLKANGNVDRSYCIRLTLIKRSLDNSDKRQGPSGPNGTNSSSSTPTNLSSSQNGHLKNGQHLNCSMSNGLLDQANSDCLDENDLSTNGLLLDDEDSLDEANTKSSSLIMNPGMNAAISQQHLQHLDASLDLTNCQPVNQPHAGSLSMQASGLNASHQPNELNASNCAITQNSITNNSIKLEQFGGSQQLPASQIGAIHDPKHSQIAQNYPHFENSYLQLEDRKVDLSNCRQSDCTALDCRPNLQCSRQSDGYSDSFNLLHNALSTESANAKCSTSLNSSLNSGAQHLPSTGKRGRAKRTAAWSSNQKPNNSSNHSSNMHSSYPIKSDPTCSPPSMIPTPPMENKLNCSGNQLHPNLVQSPLINDLPAGEFYPQSRSSILGATLQNRLNANAGYASMEMINNHRRAYPSPSSSTSSSYMSPTSQTLNHSPNSNFASTATEIQSNKFSSTSMLHPNNNAINAYPPPTRLDQTSQNVFLYNSAPIGQPTPTNLETDNQTSFGCENNTAAAKPYSNQCLSTNSNIYNVSIEQPQQVYAGNSQTNEQFSNQSSYPGSTYLSSSQQQQFVSQPNSTYQQPPATNGYHVNNFNSNSYQQAPSGGQFSFADQQYGSNKGDLFYGQPDSNYHGGSSDLAYANGQMLNDGFSATNDYYADYGNACQPFSSENYGTQDYQQLS